MLFYGRLEVRLSGNFFILGRWASWGFRLDVHSAKLCVARLELGIRRKRHDILSRVLPAQQLHNPNLENLAMFCRSSGSDSLALLTVMILDCSDRQGLVALEYFFVDEKVFDGSVCPFKAIQSCISEKLSLHCGCY